jgi:transcription elongation GreA/GreB family factor
MPLMQHASPPRALLHRGEAVSTKDPREELTHAIELCEEGLLDPEVGRWATAARERAERILETIDSMLANGQLAPTRRQAASLQNIQNGACMRMGSLQDRPRLSRAASLTQAHAGEVREGSTVELADGSTYRIGVDVSAESPVGRALMGHVCGETVEAVMPRGNTKQMTIAAVMTDSSAG